MILTDEQTSIRDSARRFSRERLLPDYQKREADDCLNRDIVREMGALGFLGSDISDEFGGAGCSSLVSGLVIEEIAYGDFCLSNFPTQASLLGAILSRSATKDVAHQWIPGIASGDVIPAICLTEPSAGSDAAQLSLRARKDGSDYILSGEKTSITFGAFADVFVVFARTDPQAGAKGISAFAVDGRARGISTSAFDDAGCRCAGRASVFFDDVRVPAECLLGDENQGFTQVMKGFDYSRALIALMCLGSAQASLDEAWRYTLERQTFGVPIATHQGVTFPLAEADAMMTAIRELSYSALTLRDQGLPHTAEAAMVKLLGPKTAFDVIHQCLLTFGHYGWSKDSPHQQRMRDVMGSEIGDGTAGIMKLIISRQRIRAITAGA
ncbi:MAG: acyl-CoA dehydrogenase family protein [Rhodobiaceae bacterium]|nr:acyl-CoA dehydrogenase family protein [Rhodobiaceae bacterium]MCC0057417.1 acyl-CoA dehydrogenase family protein [Rhodobiaceae bacterium]